MMILKILCIGGLAVSTVRATGAAEFKKSDLDKWRKCDGLKRATHTSVSYKIRNLTSELFNAQFDKFWHNTRRKDVVAKDEPGFSIMQDLEDRYVALLEEANKAYEKNEDVWNPVQYGAGILKTKHHGWQVDGNYKYYKHEALAKCMSSQCPSNKRRVFYFDSKSETYLHAWGRNHATMPSECTGPCSHTDTPTSRHCAHCQSDWKWKFTWEEALEHSATHLVYLRQCNYVSSDKLGTEYFSEGVPSDAILVDYIINNLEPTDLKRYGWTCEREPIMYCKSPECNDASHQRRHERAGYVRGVNMSDYVALLKVNESCSKTVVDPAQYTHNRVNPKGGRGYVKVIDESEAWSIVSRRIFCLINPKNIYFNYDANGNEIDHRTSSRPVAIKGWCNKHRGLHVVKLEDRCRQVGLPLLILSRRSRSLASLTAVASPTAVILMPLRKG